MANSFTTEAVQDIVAEGIREVAQTRAQGFKACVTDFSDTVNPITNAGIPKNVQVLVNTTVGTTKINPTSFENMDNTVTAKAVQLNLLSQQFGATWNSSIELKSLIKSNVNGLINKMYATRDALFTVANFGELNTVDIAGATTADKKDELFQAIWALQTKGMQKFLIAGSSLYSKGMPTNIQSFDPLAGGRIRGFDGYSEDGYLADVDPDGSTATLSAGDLKGVITDGGGIACVAQVPEWNEYVRPLLESQNYQVEELGLSIQLNLWGATGSRSGYGSLDIVFGAGVLDATATKLIGQSA